jgi:MinD-like ATPase involved in chromosome partitioning or flagellar assembly
MLPVRRRSSISFRGKRMPLPDPPSEFTRDRNLDHSAGFGGATTTHHLPTAVPPARAVAAVPAPPFPFKAAAVPGGASNGAAQRVTVHEPRPVPHQFGPADVTERAWRHAAALGSGAAIAISSADGGVGRSTLAAALGGLLALAVPEPVLAVDMVPTPWNGLGARVGRQNWATVWDTVRDFGSLTSRADVERWVQRGPSGLLALVGEIEGKERRPPHPDEASALADRLRQLFALTIWDLAPAATGPVWRSLAAATVPVLVSRATTDGLRHSLRLLTHLTATGNARVARDSVLVIMATSPSVPRQVRAVARQADDVAGAVLCVPYDPRLAQPEPIDPRLLRRRTRTALVHVADAVLQRCTVDRPALAPFSEERA